MKKYFFILICFLSSFNFSAISQEKVVYDSANMQWFEQAKLGIFTHWGIYAVNGIAESWSFYNKDISYEDYMKQLNGFSASKYDPTKWAKLFKSAGAKYAVITAKHHDGVALWDTKWSDLNVVKKTPAKRDLLLPYTTALKQQGLKVGIYFSHLDWSNPDYASLNSAGSLTEPLEKRNKFSYPLDGLDNQNKWTNFLQFHRGQLKELATQYHPDLFWFDGTWERNDADWKMKELRDLLLKWKPGVILNSRMCGYGDYETPEQAIPIIKPDGIWEYCMTINNSWGYQGKDTNYKSPRQIIRTLVECMSMGGNLLLDIGPKPDGTIQQQFVYVLQELGNWVRKHEIAVYPTIAGLLPGHCYAPTTLSKDKKIIYLYLFDKPLETIPLKGLRNNIVSIKVIGSKEKLSYKRLLGAPWMNIPGTVLINVPARLDKYVTVLEITVDKPIYMYRGKGRAIEKN